MHTLHLLLLLGSLLRCQIRIHRSHSSAFVSSTFRGLSPCRGAGALPKQLKPQGGRMEGIFALSFPSIHPLAGQVSRGHSEPSWPKMPLPRARGHRATHTESVGPSGSWILCSQLCCPEPLLSALSSVRHLKLDGTSNTKKIHWMELLCLLY